MSFSPTPSTFSPLTSSTEDADNVDARASSTEDADNVDARVPPSAPDKELMIVWF